MYKKIQGSLNQSSAQPPLFLKGDWNFQTHKGLTKREAIKWFIWSQPPTVSNLLKVPSVLIKVYKPWYNYRYFKSNKRTWVGNFCRYIVSRHKAFSCVFLDQWSSDYGEEQHTAHLDRNPPELHSITGLQLLVRHIPNILNTFKGLLCSGRTNSSSSLGHQWPFLEKDAQFTEKNKITFFHQLWYIHSKRSHPKIIGTANPSHSLAQSLQIL